MARPKVAGGGTASSLEGSCQYIEYAVTEADKGWFSGLGFDLDAKNSTT